MSKSPTTKAAAKKPDADRVTFYIGDKVLILANKKIGTVKALFARVGQLGQHSVEYVADNGVVHEAWFLAEELSAPTPKPARKR